MKSSRWISNTRDCSRVIGARGVLGFLGLVRSADWRSSAGEGKPSELDLDLLEIRRFQQRRYGFESLVGFGASHRRLVEQVRLAAASTAPVLIVGEAMALAQAGEAVEALLQEKRA